MKRPTGQRQPGLFEKGEETVDEAFLPLAERMRPQSLDEVVGQSHLVGPGRLLRQMIDGQKVHSMILWGPPGTGKTTLARLIARVTSAHFIAFSAVLSGVKELRSVIDEARMQRQVHQRRSILFVDEIHRFNKAQQDAFLPHVEDGTVILVGATTENPSFEIIAPLLSRASVLVLHPLTEEDIRSIVERALRDAERGLGSRNLEIVAEALDLLVSSARGDARTALNVLETSADLAAIRETAVLTADILQEAAQRAALRYDKGGEEHYNVISAFIKSMRGSDPDAALYWLMRMLEAGEDPLFIARRMVIFAAEDIGNADPQALLVAVAAKEAFHFVGLPEGRIPLAQAVVYLAAAPKSNASYKGMLAAAADVAQYGALAVPLHLRNAPTALMKGLGYGKGYEYAHDKEGQVVGHAHLPDELEGRQYYVPSENGAEREIGKRWASRRQMPKRAGPRDD